MCQDNKRIFDSLIAEDYFSEGEECTCADVLDSGVGVTALEANGIEPCEEIVVGKLKHFLVHEAVSSLYDAEYNIILFGFALEEKDDVDYGVDDEAHFLVALQEGLLGFYSFEQLDEPNDLDKDSENITLHSLQLTNLQVVG